MVNENNYSLMTIYETEISKKRLSLNKIIILIVILVTMLCVAITVFCVVKVIKEHNEYKRQEAQLIAMQQEQERIEAQKIALAEETERKRQEKLPKLTEEGRQNLAGIYESETKRAFLTFDDGPSLNTPEILDILERENIKATFFVLGSQVENMPETTKKIYEKGHFIASHGYSHVYSSIYSSPEAVLNEYNLSMEAIRNAIGEQEYNAHLFRFPGGLAGGKYAEIKAQARDLLAQNDILYVDWNALNGDGETNDLTPEFEMGRLAETVGEKNSIVVLMHDAQAKTVTKDTLPQIIAYLREQGYEFKNFYDVIK